MDFQTILLIGLIVMAVVNAASLIWAFHLDGQLKRKPVPKNYNFSIDSTKLLTPEEVHEISNKAEQDMAIAVAKASQDAQAVLTRTVTSLNDRVKVMIADTLSKELHAYNSGLSELRKETLDEFSSVKDQLDAQRDKLEAEFKQAIAEERKAELDRVHDRMADVVTSYIVDSLDKNVDLGAQMEYILATLEENKEDIKKDVLA